MLVIPPVWETELKGFRHWEILLRVFYGRHMTGLWSYTCLCYIPIPVTPSNSIGTSIIVHLAFVRIPIPQPHEEKP
jgi:hypothetical protein